MTYKSTNKRIRKVLSKRTTIQYSKVVAHTAKADREMRSTTKFTVFKRLKTITNTLIWRSTVFFLNYVYCHNHIITILR